MGTAFFDKTVKFLVETENPAANDILRILLDDPDWKTKSQAFDALFLKRDAAISIDGMKDDLEEKITGLSEAIRGQEA